MKAFAKFGIYALGFACCALTANAQSCSTQSRGYSFSGYDYQTVINNCHASYYTSNAECDANITCDGGMSSCSTNSRGYSFSGADSDSVISSCHASPYTSNYECDQNLVCGGINSNPGNVYYPPTPVEPPPPRYTPDEQCYLDRYPDICVNSPNNYCLDPSKHFRDYGQHEGRLWGCAAIKTAGECYLERYPDICQNSPNNYCRDPEKHYSEHGRTEGRIWGCQ